MPAVAPLLAIRPIPQPAPDLTGVAALAFTSANGVAAFAALTPDRSRPVFTVGDATAQAARAAGFARVESAGGDLDRLAALITAQGSGAGPRPFARSFCVCFSTNSSELPRENGWLLLASGDRCVVCETRS